MAPMTATTSTPFTTTLTVPTAHARELMARLAQAGFTILDTGDRVTTDEGMDAEATLHLVHIPTLLVEEADPDACILGVSR